jgi:hypothetical protein
MMALREKVPYLMVPVMQKVSPANAEVEEETAEDFRFGPMLLYLLGCFKKE